MRHARRKLSRVTLPMLEDQAIALANADAEDDAAYRRERKRLWRMWRKSVEERAQKLARKVQSRKAVG